MSEFRSFWSRVRGCLTGCPTVRQGHQFHIATLLLAIGSFGTTIIADTPMASAKTPGSTYCFYGKCHRVKSLSETRALVGKQTSLVASHYSHCSKDPYNPCGLTSSGEPFFPGRADNAASPIYPDGTILLLWSPTSNEAVVVRVNNAGPYWGNRKLDVSYGAATKLGFRKRGVAKLQVRVVHAPNRRESTYSRNRTYRRVAGPIGRFDSMERAYQAVTAMTAVEAIAGSIAAPSAGAITAAARNSTVITEVRHERVAKKAAAITASLRRGLELKPVVIREVKIAMSDGEPTTLAGESTGRLPALITPNLKLAAALAAEQRRHSSTPRMTSEAIELEQATGQAELTVVATADIGAQTADPDELLANSGDWFPGVSLRSMGVSLHPSDLPYRRRPINHWTRRPRLARGGVLG